MFNLIKSARPLFSLRKFCEISNTIVDSSIPSPEDSVLATRPLKGLLWGDGKVFLKYQKVKFKPNKFPSLKRLQKYLEHEQATNISVLALEEFKQNTIFSTLMICSGISPRHISRMAYGLLKALKEAKVPDHDFFQVLGNRDSGWMILSLKDLHIHLITEEMRPEINIEEVWKNPMKQKEIDEMVLNNFEMYKRFKKKR